MDKPRVLLCRDEGLRRSVAVLRPDVAIVHSMEIFVFFFVLLFRYSEDLSIGLMRTLKVYERVHSCL